MPKIVFYCEPSNASTLLSENRYVIDCSVDASLTDPTGKVLLDKKGLVKINRVSRSPVLDLYFKIEMDLKKLVDRSVLIKIVLHDNIKNQSFSYTRNVNVGTGAAKIPDKI